MLCALSPRNHFPHCSLSFFIGSRFSALDTLNLVPKARGFEVPLFAILLRLSSSLSTSNLVFVLVPASVTLTRRFRKASGSTIHAYQLQIRAARATTLLRGTP